MADGRVDGKQYFKPPLAVRLRTLRMAHAELVAGNLRRWLRRYAVGHL